MTRPNREGRPTARFAVDQAADQEFDAMKEVGISLDEGFPKPLTDEVVAAADVVITWDAATVAPTLGPALLRTGRSRIRPKPTLTGPR